MSRQESGARFSRRKFFTEFFAQAVASQESEEEPGDTRKQGWGKYVAAGASLAAAEAVSRMGKGEFPNMVEVEKPEADFRIFYSVHSIPNDPRTVEGADALVLEMGVSSISETENAIYWAQHN